MKTMFVIPSLIVCFLGQLNAQTYTVNGTSVIFLAGRTDIIIPALGQVDTKFPIARNSSIRSDYIKEAYPVKVSVQAESSYKITASGQVDFYTGTGNFAKPDGYAGSKSNIAASGGISGYKGPKGSLVGVFINDATYKFTATSPMTIDLNALAVKPATGQVFFIGDGKTSGGTEQIFTAPNDATHLCLGFADAYSFSGVPGYYNDNDGTLQVTIRASNSKNSTTSSTKAIPPATPRQPSSGGQKVTVILKNGTRLEGSFESSSITKDGIKNKLTLTIQGKGIPEFNTADVKSITIDRG